MFLLSMLSSRHGQLYCVRRNTFSDLYYVVYCMGGGYIFYEGTVKMQSIAITKGYLYRLLQVHQKASPASRPREISVSVKMLVSKPLLAT